MTYDNAVGDDLDLFCTSAGGVDKAPVTKIQKYRANLYIFMKASHKIKNRIKSILPKKIMEAYCNSGQVWHMH